ncbi:probable Dolichyl-phosphate-mannose--protein mannosyltransferase 1 [Saccharomycodes ludwigii]|uniref:Dolichyl-phosphate-mannose--protein mannosyltransferase n=1 Tax=Saccharomycodes ludwigii TaxID=36035 RepID=A0A376B5B6_9ASCO|nr:probable Dolichyl-phosphate-mannose--protein mannosyltransferase 1 [Saccharomycodes ludwigii]
MSKNRTSKENNISSAKENKDNVYTLTYDPVVDFDFKKGPERPFIVTAPPKKISALRTPNSLVEWFGIALLMGITLFVRLYNLSYPDSVVFDEVHFGKFASKYIRGSFFFDVHPPLAKLLFAGVGSLAGFRGDFDFENIGDFFPSTTPYVAMRFFAGICGSLTVLFMYLTLRCSGVKPWISFLASFCFILENAFVTISRYILLDSPMVCFIAAAAYAYKRFELYNETSFKAIKSLICCGIALGLSLSSKWVGLFTISWVGVLCALKLWFMLGDLNRPVCATIKSAGLLASLLLGIPLVIYLFSFYIHFQTLIYDSEASSFFSSAFRSTLINNQIPKNILADVGVGSTITIRHVNTMGGYLHSHDIPYESGSEQQQITLYPHLDMNNDWLVELYDEPNVVPTSFQNITDGTKIKLKHVSTQHRLHSHDHKPPVSENADWQKEVSCYGFEGFAGDGNDDFIVEIDKDASVPGPAQERVRAIQTKFRLRHAMTGCLLFSHDVKLPKVGQQEVTCATQGLPSLTLWYVENNENPLLPADAERVSYPTPSFFEKTIESHKKMWSINNGLTESHVYESQPFSWPFLTRGISYWSKDHRQVYLLGNAVMWYLTTATVAIFAVILFTELIRYQLGYGLPTNKEVINFHIQSFHYLLGWTLHYVPFFLMGRQLFLHHYLPSYYFGIMAFAHLLNLLVTYLPNKHQAYRFVGNAVVVCFTSAVVYFFIKHQALGYGTPDTQSSCSANQWFKGWDYACDNYLANLTDYDNLELSKPTGTLVNSVSPTDNLVNGNIIVETTTVKENDEPIDLDSVLGDNNPKKFIDQAGNEIDPKVAIEMLKKQEGSIVKVEKQKNVAQ